MAFQTPGFSLGTLLAGADLSTTGQYLFVVATGGEIVVAGAGASAVGVLNNAPADGQPAEVIVNGVAKVESGAAVTAGAKVMSNGSGQAIAATGTNFVTGIALTASDGIGEIISVLVMPMGHFALV
jgi:hypothetical protein